MLWILQIVALLIMVGGIGSWAVRIFMGDEESQRRGKKAPPIGMPIVVSVVGLILLVALSGAATVPATHIAVVENSLSGKLYQIGPGTHIWPFSPELVPLVSRVTQYDLRRQIIEIGTEPAKTKGVQADSNSPGRPVVFFFARGWAYPNRETIIELHRKYGAKYLDDWVERVWISSLKAIQGEKGYDYVGNYRVQMENDVEKGLQLQLIGDNEQPLVFVSQLAIVDFDYDDNVSGYLNEVSKLEFSRQAAEQQIIINRKLQEAATIEAETAFITTKRKAEAEKAGAIATAEGASQAIILNADANAYRVKAEADAEAHAIKAKTEAEAAGITLQRQAIGGDAQLYVELKKALQWSGQLPNYMFGGGVLPFVDVTPSGQ